MNDSATHEFRPIALLASMAHTRLELAALDVEAHVADSVSAGILGLIALVLALIASGFAGVAVIVVFWDTHRILAAALTMAGYLALAAIFAALCRARWKARRPALEAVLRELAHDRDALRDRP